MKSIIHMRWLSILFCALSALFVPACTAAQAITISEAIPTNWTLLDSCSGMLNADAFRDVVLIIQANDSAGVLATVADGADTVTARPRSILILSGTADGRYILTERNDHFIPLPTAPFTEDPYVDCRIADQRLLLHCGLWMSGGSWDSDTWTYTFAPNGPDLQLIAASWSTIHRATREGRSCTFDLASGRYLCTENPDLEEQPVKETTEGIIPGTPSRTLRTMVPQRSWWILPDVSL